MGIVGSYSHETARRCRTRIEGAPPVIFDSRCGPRGRPPISASPPLGHPEDWGGGHAHAFAKNAKIAAEKAAMRCEDSDHSHRLIRGDRDTEGSTSHHDVARRWRRDAQPALLCVSAKSRPRLQAKTAARDCEAPFSSHDSLTLYHSEYRGTAYESNASRFGEIRRLHSKPRRPVNERNQIFRQLSVEQPSGDFDGFFD
jgi:hypothetical protein